MLRIACVFMLIGVLLASPLPVDEKSNDQDYLQQLLELLIKQLGKERAPDDEDDEDRDDDDNDEENDDNNSEGDNIELTFCEQTLVKSIRNGANYNGYSCPLVQSWLNLDCKDGLDAADEINMSACMEIYSSAYEECPKRIRPESIRRVLRRIQTIYNELC